LYVECWLWKVAVRNPGSTHGQRVLTMPPVKGGRYLGPAGYVAARRITTWCWICGRPVRDGEDFGRWRLRAVRPSPRYGFEVRAICPLHYQAGEAFGSSAKP
jgi:hypothetical protein